MMNSEVRMVPVAAACDRRRTDPMNPTGRWSVAAFVRTPQIEPVIPTLRPPGQSSLIKPNQAISCRDAIQSQPPSPSTSSSPSRSSTRPIKSTIRNPSGLEAAPGWKPQSAIAPNSTWFHLIPLNSTCFHFPPPGVVPTNIVKTAKSALPNFGQSKPVKARQSVSESFSLRQVSSHHRHILRFPRPNTQPIAVYSHHIHPSSRSIRNPQSAIRNLSPSSAQPLAPNKSLPKTTPLVSLIPQDGLAARFTLIERIGG